MSNPKIKTATPTVKNAKLDRKMRLSLPEKEKSQQSVAGAGLRRNTISEEITPKARKKLKAPVTPPPTILEDEDDTAVTKTSFVIENETKTNNSKLKRNPSNISKVSAVSNRSSKSTLSYDNKAFEGNSRATTSTINDNRPTSRTPSVQSLEVYQEQYCCCSKRTKCERYLLVAVTVLGIIVIVLVIVIAFLGKSGNLEKYNMFDLKL